MGREIWILQFFWLWEVIFQILHRASSNGYRNAFLGNKFYPVLFAFLQRIQWYLFFLFFLELFPLFGHFSFFIHRKISLFGLRKALSPAFSVDVLEQVYTLDIRVYDQGVFISKIGKEMIVLWRIMNFGPQGVNPSPNPTPTPRNLEKWVPVNWNFYVYNIFKLQF